MSKSMMMIASYAPVPRPRIAPHAARALEAASRLLGRLATRLAAAGVRQPVADLDPLLEFYASAGAPEGALYLNGELVGTLRGVTRL